MNTRKSGLSIRDNSTGEEIQLNTDPMNGPVLLGFLPSYTPLHVVPINDSTPHTNMHFLDCACEPNLQLNGPQLIIVHNAYDGRA